MIDLTKLLCGTDGRHRSVRYGPSRDRDGAFSPLPLPFVVWNATSSCNLDCKHCYYGGTRIQEDELSTEEGLDLADQVDDAGGRILVFSGGEPFMRDDIFEVAEYAESLGIRTVLSTNGTRIDPGTAERVAEAGFKYVGVSLDGLYSTNDRFRGKPGAFEAAVEGMRNLQDADVPVGIRYTLTKDTYSDLPGIFDLALEEGVSRLNVFHLIYSGRGQDLVRRDLSAEETREAVDYVYERTLEIGEELHVLTAGNYADAPYLYGRLKEDFPERAEATREMLYATGTGRVVKKGSGPKLANVDPRGDVYPSQFLADHLLGNVRHRSLRDIWSSSDLVRDLINPEEKIKGRCGECGYLPVCGGNSRARAEAVHGDIWASDPACYLTDEEIEVSQKVPA